MTGTATNTYEAVDDVKLIEKHSSTLSAPITNNSTSLTLEDASTFPLDGKLTIGDTELYYTSKTGNTIDLSETLTGTLEMKNPDIPDGSYEEKWTENVLSLTVPAFQQPVDINDDTHNLGNEFKRSY